MYVTNWYFKQRTFNERNACTGGNYLVNCRLCAEIYVISRTTLFYVVAMQYNPRKEPSFVWVSLHRLLYKWCLQRNLFTCTHRCGFFIEAFTVQCCGPITSALVSFCYLFCFYHMYCIIFEKKPLFFENRNLYCDFSLWFLCEGCFTGKF